MTEEELNSIEPPSGRKSSSCLRSSATVGKGVRASPTLGSPVKASNSEGTLSSAAESASRLDASALGVLMTLSPLMALRSGSSDSTTLVCASHNSSAFLNVG
ncbi:unnamed protein product [Phytophthora fragariaefolia]|uniref:Unnamed protein product n=1 Tax=Phytophthora fragariaefolia TaxID=1490495 RepID=A0A9W6U1C7_9STRA|nr:unnamed protein product [Phytophthora fragariaefolia]